MTENTDTPLNAAIAGGATVVGRAANNVETRKDTYANYYVTKIELAEPRSLHKRQQKLLENDPLFSGQLVYVVTAVQELQSGKLKGRKLYVNEEQLTQIGFELPKADAPIGDGSSVVPAPQRKVSFETYGQYVDKFGFHSYCFTLLPGAFPRVQNIKETKDATNEEAQRVNTLLKNPKNVRWSLHLRYQAPLEP